MNCQAAIFNEDRCRESAVAQCDGCGKGLCKPHRHICCNSVLCDLCFLDHQTKTGCAEVPRKPVAAVAA